MAPRVPAEDLDDEEELDPRREGQGGDEGDEDDAGASGQDEEGGEGEEGQEDDLLGELPPERETRGGGRISRLANENADLKRRLADVETRLRPAAPVQATQPQEETDDQFKTRIALLAPHEQMMEMQARSERRFDRYMRMQTLQTQDQLDKANFDAKAASSPRYKRYAEDVERLRAELMQQGQMVPRQVLLEVVIGRRVLANDDLGKGKGQQRAQARERVQLAQAKPGQARSDVGSSRGQQTEAQKRAKRLENMQI